MKPIKPKFKNSIKIEFDITPKTREILIQYSKYTKYLEGEIIDMIASEILQDDNEFLEWLNSRRYKRKIDGVIFEKGTTDLTTNEGGANLEKID